MDYDTIPHSDEALLAECDVETFRAGGPGGQHQNTTDSAVRLKHRPTGLVVTCRSRRSQHLNRQECLGRLRKRLEDVIKPRVERVPTKPSWPARQRRLLEKRKRSEKKRARRTPDADG